METKVLQVFYGKDCLPYKDKERSVHFPIVGAAIQGASNTTKIRFYFDELVEEDDQTTTWVVVSKLPNGKIGSEIVETELDEELNEHYTLFTLKNFYTQAKGDLFLSLQGYQGGVQVETDPDTGISQIVGTPTIQATGSIKLAINYATQLVGSGETDNINFQKILADLGTKLGIRAYTERVTELPTTGQTNVFYAIYDDPNNPNKLNIYVWNGTTQSYVWVGDNTLYLGNYYTQEQGEQFENGINNRVASVENELESVASGAPSGAYANLAAVAAAFPTGNSNIYITLDNGHWCYWNGSAWTDGGVYLSTGDAVPDTRKVAGNTLQSDISVDTMKYSLDVDIAEKSLNGLDFLLNKGKHGYINDNGELVAEDVPSTWEYRIIFRYLVSKITFTNAHGVGIYQVFFYDKNMNLISRYGKSQQSYNINVPSNCYYIGINMFDQENHYYDNGFTLISKTVDKSINDYFEELLYNKINVLSYLDKNVYKNANAVNSTKIATETSITFSYSNASTFNGVIFGNRTTLVNITNNVKKNLILEFDATFEENPNLKVVCSGSGFYLDYPIKNGHNRITIGDDNTLISSFTYIFFADGSERETALTLTISNICLMQGDSGYLNEYIYQLLYFYEQNAMNGDLVIKSFDEPKVYKNANPIGATKTYTNNSVTFAYSDADGFNGIVFGNTTQSPVSFSSNVKKQLIMDFDAQFSYNNTSVEVCISGSGGAFFQKSIKVGHNKIIWDLEGTSDFTITYIYFRDLSGSTSSQTLTISNIVLYQGNEYVNFHIYGKLYEMQKLLASNPFKNKKILTIGDSLTNSQGENLNWQNFIIERFEMLSPFLNAGYAGANVANVGDNTIYSHVMALTVDNDCEIITFWGGTNDWGASVPLGDFDTQKDVATRDNTTFYGALFDCVEKILTLYPTKSIMLVGTTQRIYNVSTVVDNNATVNSLGLKLVDYVDAVKKVAEYYSIPFLDLYRKSGINRFNMSNYMLLQGTSPNQYYLHFNGNGERLIGKKFIEFIERYYL